MWNRKNKTNEHNKTETAQNRHTDQQGRMEGSEVNSHTDGQLIYNQGGENIHAEKTLSSISGTGKTGQLRVKE